MVDPGHRAVRDCLVCQRKGAHRHRRADRGGVAGGARSRHPGTGTGRIQQRGHGHGRRHVCAQPRHRAIRRAGAAGTPALAHPQALVADPCADAGDCADGCLRQEHCTGGNFPSPRLARVREHRHFARTRVVADGLCRADGRRVYPDRHFVQPAHRQPRPATRLGRFRRVRVHPPRRPAGRGRHHLPDVGRTLAAATGNHHRRHHAERDRQVRHRAQAQCLVAPGRTNHCRGEAGREARHLCAGTAAR